MALLQGQERFYVGSEFRPTVSYLLGDFSHFAPWYTIACIVIFAVFRLYGGMWRYAGINDMNRIILARDCGFDDNHRGFFSLYGSVKYLLDDRFHC